MRTILRVKSQAMTVSVRTPWRAGSALKDGRSIIVMSGEKARRSARAGRIIRLRMKRSARRIR